MDSKSNLPLPNGWTWTPLPQLGELNRGKSKHRPRNDPKLYGGKYPFIQTGDIRQANGYLRQYSQTYNEEGLKQSRLWSSGTLCITIAANIAETAILGFDACFPDSIVGFSAEPSICDVRFVELFIRTAKENLERYAPATAQKNINLETLVDLAVPLPPPAEQRRIVAKIEELFTKLDAGVASLKAAKKQLKRYRQSVLKAAVEGELTREWREKHKEELEPASVLLERILKERRAKWEADQLAKMQAQGKPPKDDKWKAKYQEPAAPNSNNLQKLPQRWSYASPEQLAASDNYALAIGPFGSNLKVADYRDDGTPLIFVRNIRMATFTGPTTRYVSEAKASELRPHQVLGGDILITKMGDPPGDACLYPEKESLAIITADCIKWTLTRTLSQRHYFVNAINSRQIRVQIQQITKGVAQQKVSLERFKTIGIPLPPIHEQEQIVAEIERRLSVADEIEATLDAELKHAERLRQSILKRAFEGKLVPQDPNDEPASALLERIRAERAQLHTNEKKSGRKKH